MSYSTRIKILNTDWSLEATPWESISVFEEEYSAAKSAAAPGETIYLDMTGRYFSAKGTALPDPSVNDSSRYELSQGRNGDFNDLTITGGTYSGGIIPSWSSSGVLKTADIYDSTGGFNPKFENVRLFELDKPLSGQPRMATYPRPASGYENNPTASNSTWLTLGTNLSGGSISTDGNGKVSGITITDSALRLEVNSALGGSDIVDASANIKLLGLTGPNVIYTFTIASWTLATGTIVFEEPLGASSSYFKFCFTGRQAYVQQPGDFARVRNTENGHDELLFYPFADTVLGNVQYPVISSPMFLYNGDSNSTIRLNNCTWVGGAQYALQHTAASNLVVTNGDASYSWSGAVSTPPKGTTADFVDCHMHDFNDRCIQASDGTTVTGSRLYGTQKSEIIAIYVNQVGRVDGDSRALCTIKHNIISGPVCNHGTGLNLYMSSWTNAIVEHNIFINNLRHLGLSRSGTLVSDAGGTCSIQNNLFISDSLPEASGGQRGFAENSGEGDVGVFTLPEGPMPNMHINFGFNTLVGNLSQPEVVNLSGMSFPNYYFSDVNVVGNVASEIQASFDHSGNSTPLNENVCYAGDNYIWGPEPISFKTSWSSADIPLLDNLSSYDYPNLTPTGSLLTSASDGGRIGHRWDTSTNELTLSAIYTKLNALVGPSDIETYWPELSTPDPESYSPVALSIGDVPQP